MVLPQQDFINYARDFCRRHCVNFTVSGSFGNNTFTEYSDVDIAIATGDSSLINQFIYGYGQVIYLSATANPKGIIIIIYENGVAVDLEILADALTPLIDDKRYIRNKDIYVDIVPDKGVYYHYMRLFHRGLIKILSGKGNAGIGVLNELAELISSSACFDDKNTFRINFIALINDFEKICPLPELYKREIMRLFCKLYILKQ